LNYNQLRMSRNPYEICHKIMAILYANFAIFFLEFRISYNNWIIICYYVKYNYRQSQDNQT